MIPGAVSIKPAHYHHNCFALELNVDNILCCHHSVLLQQVIRKILHAHGGCPHTEASGMARVKYIRKPVTYRLAVCGAVWALRVPGRVAWMALTLSQYRRGGGCSMPSAVGHRPLIVLHLCQRRNVPINIFNVGLANYFISACTLKNHPFTLLSLCAFAESVPGSAPHICTSEYQA